MTTGAASPAAAIRGIFLPVATPFDADGAPDEPLYAQMVDYYATSGVQALFVLGSFGQGATLEVAQRQRALEIAIEAADGRVPVVPDIGTVDPFRSRQLAEHAVRAGADALMTVAPYYYTDRSPDELMLHLELVTAGLDQPLFLYHNPSYQGHTIAPDVVARIRERVPTLIGMAHAGDSMASIVGYLNALGDDFKIFASALNLFPGMLGGVAGALTPPLSFVPRAGVALVAAIDRADYAEATRLQLAILDFMREIARLRRWFRPVQREALRHLGFAVQVFPRWPTPDLPDEIAARVHDAIDNLNDVLTPRAPKEIGL